MTNQRDVDLQRVQGLEQAYLRAAGQHEAATALAEQQGFRGALGRVVSSVTGWRLGYAETAYKEEAWLHAATAIPESSDRA